MAVQMNSNTRLMIGRHLMPRALPANLLEQQKAIPLRKKPERKANI